MLLGSRDESLAQLHPCPGEAMGAEAVPVGMKTLGNESVGMLPVLPKRCQHCWQRPPRRPLSLSVNSSRGIHSGSLSRRCYRVIPFQTLMTRTTGFDSVEISAIHDSTTFSFIARRGVWFREAELLPSLSRAEFRRPPAPITYMSAVSLGLLCRCRPGSLPPPACRYPTGAPGAGATFHLAVSSLRSLARFRAVLPSSSPTGFKAKPKVVTGDASIRQSDIPKDWPKPASLLQSQARAVRRTTRWRKALSACTRSE